MFVERETQKQWRYAIWNEKMWEVETKYLGRKHRALVCIPGAESLYYLTFCDVSFT